MRKKESTTTNFQLFGVEDINFDEEELKEAANAEEGPS